MSNNSTVNEFTQGMKDEASRMTEGLKTGPSSDATRDGEMTEGMKDAVDKLTGSSTTSSNVAGEVAQGAKDEYNAVTDSGPSGRMV